MKPSLLHPAIIAVSVCFSAAASAAAPADLAAHARNVQSERLLKHSFVGKRADDKAPGLLLGNTALGACLDASGLGLRTLWSADLWRNPNQRLPLPGPKLSCPAFTDQTPVSYQQTLGLRDGLAVTTVRHAAGTGYDAEVFCSMDDPSLVVMRVTTHGTSQQVWRLDGALTPSPALQSPQVVTGRSAPDAFTPFGWRMTSNRPLKQADDHFVVDVTPGQAWVLVWCVQPGDTGTSGPVAPPEFAVLLEKHRAAWSQLWQPCAVLALPDAELERLWYRSLYWTLSTCGSARYLPGESMFAVPCWDMHPFTYGAAGWATQAFTAVGHAERAKRMLDWHLQPAALRANAVFYTQAIAGGSASSEAMAFAHEVTTDGNHIPCAHYEMQRHLDGFGAALFERHRRFYPGQSVSHDAFYQLLKGLASFWCGLAKRDDASGEYVLPNMTSLTEDLIAVHPIDAALAAKWCLIMAHREAVALNRDAGRREQWQQVALKLHIPQNDSRYLEFHKDPDQRPGGGYQGVRGFVYLGWPTTELIPTLDRDKALRTLDHTWDRNLKGEGMIGFVANWFALADLHYGRGDHALSILKHNFRCEDAWQQGVSETPGNLNYHFTTNYASYLLVPLAMAVQSFDDQIHVFHGMPRAWKDFAFYQVPAEAGIRVSGAMQDGKVAWLNYQQNGKLLRHATAPESIRITRNRQAIELKPQ